MPHKNISTAHTNQNFVEPQASNISEFRCEVAKKETRTKHAKDFSFPKAVTKCFSPYIKLFFSFIFHPNFLYFAIKILCAALPDSRLRANTGSFLAVITIIIADSNKPKIAAVAKNPIVATADSEQRNAEITAGNPTKVINSKILKKISTKSSFM